MRTLTRTLTEGGEALKRKEALEEDTPDGMKKRSAYAKGLSKEPAVTHEQVNGQP
jgi:hypothetical protein